jgi:RES domain-containing protein
MKNRSAEGMEIAALELKALCHRCVGEEYLSAEIRIQGKRTKCAYCGRQEKAYRLGAVAERIDGAFQQHYVRTSDQPDAWESAMLSDRELDYDWERHGEPVEAAIMNAAEIPEPAASDIQRILEERYSDYEAAMMGDETEFAAESYYEERGAEDGNWRDEWLTFERTLKTEARFFSRWAADHLASVFEGIGSMVTHDGRPLVIDAGPGTKLKVLYRARVFQSDSKLESALKRPDLELGSPPSWAATAGRMNALGISVFYGADRAAVALAEVRPPVGSRVGVARFHIIRPLRLLDLVALGAVSTRGSIFDPTYATRLERETFLRSLSQRMTRAIMPDDEASEYLVTQAIADYLATDSVEKLDGIIFPSVQAQAGRNVVLFHKAARIEAIELPAGTEITATLGWETEDGWDEDYWILEQTPRTDTEPENQTGSWPSLAPAALLSGPEALDGHARPATLRIDTSAVWVHTVKRVRVVSEKHAVRRFRTPMSPEDF